MRFSEENMAKFSSKEIDRLLGDIKSLKESVDLAQKGQIQKATRDNRVFSSMVVSSPSDEVEYSLFKSQAPIGNSKSFSSIEDAPPTSLFGKNNSKSGVHSQVKDCPNYSQNPKENLKETEKLQTKSLSLKEKETHQFFEEHKQLDSFSKKGKETMAELDDDPSLKLQMFSEDARSYFAGNDSPRDSLTPMAKFSEIGKCENIKKSSVLFEPGFHEAESNDNRLASFEKTEMNKDPIHAQETTQKAEKGVNSDGPLCCSAACLTELFGSDWVPLKKERIQERKRKKAILKKEIIEQKEEASQLLEQLQMTHHRIGTLEGKLEMSLRSSELEEENTKMSKEQTESLKKELETQEKEAVHLKKRNKELKTTLKELEGKLSESNKKMEETRKKLEDSFEEIRLLKSKKQVIEAQINESVSIERFIRLKFQNLAYEDLTKMTANQLFETLKEIARMITESPVDLELDPRGNCQFKGFEKEMEKRGAVTKELERKLKENQNEDQLRKEKWSKMSLENELLEETIVESVLIEPNEKSMEEALSREDIEILKSAEHFKESFEFPNQPKSKRESLVNSLHPLSGIKITETEEDEDIVSLSESHVSQSFVFSESEKLKIVNYSHLNGSLDQRNHEVKGVSSQKEENMSQQSSVIVNSFQNESGFLKSSLFYGQVSNNFAKNEKKRRKSGSDESEWTASLQKMAEEFMQKDRKAQDHSEETPSEFNKNE